MVKGKANRSGKGKSVWEFFGLVFALAVPFWLFGKKRLPLAIKLPGSALAFVNPVIAAAVLTHREADSRGVRELLQKTFDFKKIPNKAWLLPILLLNPAISLASYAVMRLTGLPLPAEPKVPLRRAPAYSAMFFVTGACEELGWQGYAYDRLRARWGAQRAGLLLGLAWAIYHLIPDIQNGQKPGWIFWHRLGTILHRVLICWIYEHTGQSVFGAILFHTTSNVCWALFPNNGSHYNPVVTTAITAGLVAAGAGPSCSRDHLQNPTPFCAIEQY